MPVLEAVPLRLLPLLQQQLRQPPLLLPKLLPLRLQLRPHRRLQLRPHRRRLQPRLQQPRLLRQLAQQQDWSCHLSFVDSSTKMVSIRPPSPEPVSVGESLARTLKQSFKATLLALQPPLQPRLQVRPLRLHLHQLLLRQRLQPPQRRLLRQHLLAPPAVRYR